MSKTVVNVVVNVLTDSITEPFSYKVPDSMEGTLQVGSCVLVPFGSRPVIGYVSKKESSHYSGPLKDIQAVLESKPAFDESFLSLAQWMASRYHCGLAETLRCIVPWPIASRVLTRYEWRNGSSIPNSLRPNSLRLAHLLLENPSGLDPAEIKKNLGTEDLSSLLKPLRDADCIQEIHTLEPPKAKIKTARVVTLEISKEEALFHAARLKNAPKQAELLRLLAEKDDSEIAVSEISSCLNAISPLEKKKWVRPHFVEVRRNPWRWDPAKQKTVTLTEDQTRTLNQISQSLSESSPKPLLIHGVTASGKTEVYLRAIEETLRQGRDAIMLVPEISLTAQVLDTFKGRFGDEVAILHSQLSTGERYDEWRRIQNGDARVVLAARSGVFAPVHHLGLIILDEEHEASYKQDSSPRYHAKDVAARRAWEAHALLILGSATPSVETYYRAQQGKIQLAEMLTRVEERPFPDIKVVDLRQEFTKGRKSVFASELKTEIQKKLDAGEQTILFLNRRGFSTVFLCRECGYVAKCPNCSVSLTYHASQKRLACHHCGYETIAPDACPKCNGIQIRHFGIGTEKVEQETHDEFPNARVIRMDRDTTQKKDSHTRIHRTFREGEADILIGTQMVAKGFDFPNVTLVGVITADTSLNMPDFRASERAYQLMTQVSGRAGRGKKPGEVIIQTFDPENFSILATVSHSYKEFYEEEIENRREVGYPPFSVLANILSIDDDAEKAEQRICAFMDILKGIVPNLPEKVTLLGPSTASLARLKGKYRWHLLLKAPNRPTLENLLQKAAAKSSKSFSGLVLDIDPQNLL